MEWISVKDRLPEPLHRDVLMYIASERDYILVDHGIIMGYKGGGSGWMSHMFDDEFYCCVADGIGIIKVLIRCNKFVSAGQ